MENYKDIQYIIKHTTRKNSIALVFNGRNVEISAPKRTNKRVIEKFIAKHYDFIVDKVNNTQAFTRNYTTGEEILIGGQIFTLQINLSNSNELSIDGNILNLNIESDDYDLKKALIEKYLRKISEIDIKALVLKHAEIMKLYPTAVKLNKAEKRWGSCNYTTKTLNFSIRNAMLEDWVQEYIVIHELAHLKHPNHSASFWSFVEKFMPDYKEAEKYIKLNTNLLKI